MPKEIGNLVGYSIDANQDSASASWSIQDQYRYKLLNKWPKGAIPPTTQIASISHSLLFCEEKSTFLYFTPQTSGNRQTWTWSAWVKKTHIKSTTRQTLFCGPVAQNFTRLYFDTGDSLRFENYNNGFAATTAVFRDPSAWYHILCSVDTTNSNEPDRIRLFVNGIRQDLSSYSAPTVNSSLYLNQNSQHRIGSFGYAGFDDLYDGYMTQVYFIDGEALDPDSFGFFDSIDVWQPIEYDGNYGDNGFFLDISNATKLGEDFSGNDNDLTPNNMYHTFNDNKIYGSRGFVPARDVGVDPYWVDISPDTAIISYNSNSLRDATDGNNNSYVYFTGGDYSHGFVRSISFDLRDFLPLSSLGIDCTGNSTYYYMARFLDENKQVISGTDKSLNSTSRTTATMTVSASVRYVQIYLPTNDDLSSYRLLFYGLVVNGSALNDTKYCNEDIRATPNIYMNIVKDSPTDTGTYSGTGGDISSNYATLNPILSSYTNNYYPSGGNLVEKDFVGWHPVASTFAIPNTGKWFFSTTLSYQLRSNSTYAMCGFASMEDRNTWTYLTDVTGVLNTDFLLYENNATSITSSTYSDAGTELGFAIDIDNWTYQIYKDGGLYVNRSIPYSQGEQLVAISLNYSGPYEYYIFNFGQRAFLYPPPSGYKTLCSANLPSPTIGDGSTAMDAVIYDGNGGTKVIDGLQFSPDFIWQKSRTQPTNHWVFDTNRGLSDGALVPNTTAITDDSSTTLDIVDTITSDGWNVVYNNTTNFNKSNAKYVGYAWDSASANSTNTDGSKTSQVRANQINGFSIVTYTGGAGNTVGHGLGSTPKFYFVKNSSGTVDGWKVYHHNVPSLYPLELDNSNPYFTTWAWGAPNSLTINIYNVNGSGVDYVAYCFSEVVGYSRFDYYVGNNSIEGPFIHTGFRPRFILIKNIIFSGYPWTIFDTARNTYNVSDNSSIIASVPENNAYPGEIDILSNGFKIRSSNSTSYINRSGDTHIYAAFAENPFNYSRAR